GPDRVRRYRKKLSVASLASIDRHPTVARDVTVLDAPAAANESSATAAAQVARARQRQLDRQGCANAFLDLNGLREHCRLQDEDRHWLEQACERLGLSLRAAHRILKVARTLADLAGLDALDRQHLAEALHYRPARDNA